MAKKHPSGLKNYDFLINLILFIIIQFSFINYTYSLIISEIFYGTDDYITINDRYIELYNNSDTNVDLSTIKLDLPASSQTIMVSLSLGYYELDQTNIITNSYILPPYHYAIIITEDYSKGAQPFHFNENTLILKPSSKNNFRYSWKDKLHNIKLLANNNVIFSLSTIKLDQNVFESMDSISYINNSFVKTKISPGINNSSYFYSDKLLLKNITNLKIYYKSFSNINLNEIEVNINFSNTNYNVKFKKNISNVYEYNFILPDNLNHGDNIIFSYNNNYLKLRYVNLKEKSYLWNKILINEIITDPLLDYSGGDWTGADGENIINSYDQWIELVNTTNIAMDLSRFYIYYKGRYTERVDRIYFKNNNNFLSKTFIDKYNYSVIKPENSIGNSGYIALYDNHPYKNGRLVDEVEYGDYDICNDGIYNNAPSGKSTSLNNESISRIPNAVYNSNYSRVFIKTNSSFCKPNLSEIIIYTEPVIGLTNKDFFIIDFNETNDYITASVFNKIDFVYLNLYNKEIYFKGRLNLQETNIGLLDNILQVENGILNYIVYKDITNTFFYTKKGFLPLEKKNTLKDAIVFPSPYKRNDTSLYFGNITEKTMIFILDQDNNIIKRLSDKNLVNKDSLVYEWRVKLYPGIYTVVFINEKEKVYRRLLVE